MTAIVHSICRSTFALPATIVLFLLAIFLQWNGAQSVAVADDIAYVTGGVNLVTTGSFTNPFGEPELWFPPVYPLAIGILSLGGLFDPFVVARLISVAAAVVTLILVHRLLERVLSSDDSGSHYLSLVPTIATLLLAMNPTFQTYANRALSESLAACLTITALSVWLRVEARILRSVLTGLFVALAALTRPECVLVLPLWCGLEVLFRRNLASVKHGLVAGLVCAAVLLPYSTWLHQHTGKWSISNKGEVNLSAGRSAFHGTPREFIDPVSLVMGYYTQDVSPEIEARRYLFNWDKLRIAFLTIYYGPMLGVAVFASLVYGAITLWRNKPQFTAAVLATAPYLVLVCIFDVGGPKNLHAVIPLISILTATCLSRFITHPPQRYLGAVPLCLLIALVAEGGTRFPRWTATEKTVPGIELREAGLHLRGRLPESAVMYEHGSTIGYYSNCMRRRLTVNDFDTIRRYIDRVESPTAPVYLAIGDAHREFVHPTVAELIDANPPILREIYRSTEAGQVVVYELLREVSSSGDTLVTAVSND